VNLSAHIEETMAAQRGLVTGHLVIGCTSTPGKYVLPWLVGSFCQEYPYVQVAVEAIRRSDVLQKLERQDINLGIMSGQIEHPDLAYEDFIEDELVLIVPAQHAFATQESIALEALRGQTIILREQAAGTRVTMLKGLESAGLSLDDFRVAAMELGSAESVIAAVEAGWGISWVSMVAARRAIEMGKIRTVEVEALSLRRTIYLVSHRQRASTLALQRFYEFVHSPAGEAILRQLSIKPPP
jgi:DNA-binding transcriptional LysR family regulator